MPMICRFYAPILVKCYSFKTRRTKYCLHNMKRNHVLRNQPLIEGLHLILKVFQDVLGVPQIFISGWMVQNYYLPNPNEVLQRKDVY